MSLKLRRGDFAVLEADPVRGDPSSPDDARPFVDGLEWIFDGVFHASSAGTGNSDTSCDRDPAGPGSAEELRWHAVQELHHALESASVDAALADPVQLAEVKAALERLLPRD